MFTTALLISTYNWPDALRLCIQSVNNQTIVPDEVIVCDDGSTDATKKLIEELSKKINAPIKHIWQPDDGFQLAKIRNKGIAATKKDYIIQVDGDVILHKNFIKDHIKIAKKNYFVTGSRVLLSKKITEKLVYSPLHLNHSHLYMAIENRNKMNGVRIPLLQRLLVNFYKNTGKNKYYVKGCNMAFWREDLLQVNGYNESFVGWGLEDNDIAIRLMNLGIKKQMLKFGGICYHLHHSLVSRAFEEENRNRLKDVINSKVIRAKAGISQYL